MAVGLALVSLAGLLIVILGWLGTLGKLPRNGAAGIRTPYTMRSDENWMATHRAAGPLMMFGGIAIFVVGLAFLPFTLAGKVAGELVAGVTLGLSAILVLVIVAAWQYGVRRSKAELGN